jgi:hypothetical protein
MAKEDKEKDNLAKEIVGSYDKSLEMIRNGRRETKMKILDNWNDFYNTLATICFTLGGALIAIVFAVSDNPYPKIISFWIGLVLLLADGVFILVTRVMGMEFDSKESIAMGYEEEYYLFVARNRMLEFRNGEEFKQDEFTNARNKALDVMLRQIDPGSSNKLDRKSDIALSVFLCSFGFLLITLFPSSINRVFDLVLMLIVAIIFVVFFLIRSKSEKVKGAIRRRDYWNAKIKGERENHLPSRYEPLSISGQKLIELLERVDKKIIDKIPIKEQKRKEVEIPGGGFGVLPSKEELALVQEARDNKPYSSIFNVRITRNESGEITNMMWSES